MNLEGQASKYVLSAMPSLAELKGIVPELAVTSPHEVFCTMVKMGRADMHLRNLEGTQ